MKLKAIIFMCNDHERLDFTLKNFRKFHPNIPILVYNNGGKSAKNVASRYKCDYKDIENIWHKDTHCNTGSFDFKWFEYLFEYGLRDDNTTHTLFLETDILTIKPIEKEPLYDMSGPLGLSGVPDIFWYDYFDLKSIDHSKYMDGAIAYPHTGCGGTIYRKEFFRKCLYNLPKIKQAYIDHPEGSFMDLLITILGIISGCTIGSWAEAKNIHGGFIENDGKYIMEFCKWNSALIHGVKFKSNFQIFKLKVKTKLKGLLLQ